MRYDRKLNNEIEQTRSLARATAHQKRLTWAYITGFTQTHDNQRLVTFYNMRLDSSECKSHNIGARVGLTSQQRNKQLETLSRVYSND